MGEKLIEADFLTSRTHQMVLRMGLAGNEVLAQTTNMQADCKDTQRGHRSKPR